MIVNVRGIVVRSIKYGEYDRLVTVLTEDRGKILFRACGVCSLKSKNAASCQTFVFAEFILESKKDRYYLKKARPLHSMVKIGSDLLQMSLAYYLCEVSEDCAYEVESSLQIIKLLVNALYILDKNDRSLDLIKAVFELRLLSALGYMPQLHECDVCQSPVKSDRYVYFDMLEGSVVCEKCQNNSFSPRRKMTRELCALIERSISQAEASAYTVVVEAQLLSEFYDFSQAYLLAKLERNFKTLDFYKQARDG